MAVATSSPTDEGISESPAVKPAISLPSIGLAAVGLVAWGHLPLVVTYIQRLLLFEHYQFVPLVLVGVPILMIARARGIPRTAWRGGFPHRTLFVSCGMLSVASVFCSPWAAMISLVASTGLFLRYFAGRRWRTLLPVWMLLWLLIRPPLHLDLSLIAKLQIETSKVSSIVLENLGVKHLMDGNVLVIPQRRFLVEEACSGINSVFALLTAAAVYAVCVRATAFRAALLIGSAVFWACFMNLVRIAATIFAYEQLQIDLGEGTAHTVAGFVTFALAVLFVAFTDQMIRFFSDPIDPQAVEFWEQRLNPFVTWWNRTRPVIEDDSGAQSSSGRPFAPLKISATIAVGSVSMIAAGWQVLALRAEAQSHEAPAVIANLEAGSLPARLDDWTQTGFDIQHRKKNSILGDVSKIWTYQGPSYSAMVSIDYPFRGWHSLGNCYQGQGWEIDEYRAVPLAPVAGGERTSVSEAMMHRDSGEQAQLLFVVLDVGGRALQDPTIGSFWLQTARRIVERIRRPFALHLPQLAPELGVTTQLQILIATEEGPIPTEVQNDVRERFAQFHTQLSGLLGSNRTPATAGDEP
ncbi:MAG: exosortase U [Planctomycetaceae bacterium]